MESTITCGRNGGFKVPILYTIKLRMCVRVMQLYVAKMEDIPSTIRSFRMFTPSPVQYQ